MLETHTLVDGHYVTPDDHDDNRYGEGITLSLNPLAKFNP